MKSDRSARGGAVLLCVLACLGVATAIVMVSIRSSLRARRQMRQELQLEQTRWLLDAGVAYAKSRLRTDPDYEGELWQVDPGFGSYAEATLEIAISSDDVPANQLRLQVAAKLKTDEPLSKPTVRSSTLLVERTEPNSNNP